MPFVVVNLEHETKVVPKEKKFLDYVFFWRPPPTETVDVETENYYLRTASRVSANVFALVVTIF
eukprot:m.472202 g.472202  ORF g.472202 m.472202 type:complete len:64 (+) comp32256_c0_seq1:524-715(+)